MGRTYTRREIIVQLTKLALYETLLICVNDETFVEILKLPNQYKWRGSDSHEPIYVCRECTFGRYKDWKIVIEHDDIYLIHKWQFEKWLEYAKRNEQEQKHESL